MQNKVKTHIADELLGKEITIEGFAANCKGGACFKLKDNNVIYILNKDSWEAELIGKKFILQGRLERRKIIPEPVIDEDGGISQGAYGDQYILANYKIIKTLKK